MPILPDELRLALIADEFARIGASDASWEQNFGYVPAGDSAVEVQAELSLPFVSNVAPGGASGVQLMPTGEIAAMLRADAPVGSVGVTSAGGERFYVWPAPAGPVDPEGFGPGFQRVGAPRAVTPAVAVPFVGGRRTLPWAGVRAGAGRLGRVRLGAII